MPRGESLYARLHGEAATIIRRTRAEPMHG
ncbi:Uncharacterised protein [Vibrio cholerae]|nr:Uncharacterised protein [Vibrio cholerae]